MVDFRVIGLVLNQGTGSRRVCELARDTFPGKNSDVRAWKAEICALYSP